MRSRESFFECVYVRDGSEYRFHVRAWDAKAAEEQFRAELEADGVREPGKLEVFGRKGVRLIQSDYAFAPA